MQDSYHPRSDQRDWDWEPRFALRASTVMLLYVGLLFVLGTADARYGFLPEPLVDALELCGWSCGGVLLVAALLALAFFIESLIVRRPQLQFLLELVVALGTYAALPRA
jgi:hypothetical protein